ncbi:insulinase family protein [Parashewanella curva]|uniref:Insulinase family protein n=1 Tax=Parashewanella curva TaxID=2338552 RepID=A0A3L8PZC5_9GAMM|nr:pitrilysin family protein [Parashewanella curva]RLV59878.1 insulinase family protein [Parashewanella curva]
MATMKKIAAAVILACATSSVTMLPATAEAKPSIVDQVNVNYEKFTLDNGLRVIVHSDHSTPSVFVGVWYGVGSKDEPAGKSGFAHLFEHLMFQGTENRDGEYFLPFTKAGAVGMNGTTNQDRTNYYATVPSSAVDMALWMESDRMSNLLGAVTKEALDEQRAVVKNEKRQGENRPYGRAFERILNGIYPKGHPYQHTVIGSMDDLNNASMEDVHQWYKDYYGASNAVVVLSGDITTEEARKKVQHYFGDVRPGKPLDKILDWQPKLTTVKKEVIYDKVGAARIYRIWPMPNHRTKDSALLYIAGEALAGGKNSPLNKILVDDLKLATNVSASANAQIMSGLFFVTVDVRPGVDVAKVEEVLDRELDKFLKKGPDSDLIENTVYGVNSFFVSSMESAGSIGRFLVEGELYHNDPLNFKKSQKWFNSANTKNIKAVANKWLAKPYYELQILPSSQNTAKATDVDRSKIPAVGAVGNVKFPSVESTTLDNGLKIVVAKRDKLPLVSVGIEFKTGSAADHAYRTNTAATVFGQLNKGSDKYDANELSAEFDKIAMSPQIRGGTESSSFSYGILSQKLEESLELAAETIINPSFPNDELKKYKDNAEGYFINLERNPGRAGRGLFTRAIYGADSPLGTTWTRENLNALTRDDLIKFHQNEITPQNTTIYLVGDIDLKQAKNLVEDAFEDWKNTGKSQLKAVGKAKPNKARVILIDNPNAIQSNITVGHAIPAYDTKTAETLELMNAALGGGFSGRINMNLREDKGWTYGAYSRIGYNDSGDMYISAGGGFQTDKTIESIKELKKEFTDYVQKRPITHDEMARDVANKTRSIPSRYNSNAGFSSSIQRSARLGLPFNDAENRSSRLQSVSIDDIKHFAKKTIKPDALTWVIVGDLDKIEKDVRALKLGEVEVWDAYGNKVRY